MQSQMMRAGWAFALSVLLCAIAFSGSDGPRHSAPMISAYGLAAQGRDVALSRSKGQLVEVDVTGVPSWGVFGNPGNTVLEIPLAPNAHVTGIGLDVVITAFPPSWLSDMRVVFTDVDIQQGVIVTVGSQNNPGTEAAEAFFDLVDFGFDFEVGDDGNLRIEFYEFIDDIPGKPDGVWESGMLFIEYKPQVTPTGFTDPDEFHDALDPSCFAEKADFNEFPPMQKIEPDDPISPSGEMFAAGWKWWQIPGPDQHVLTPMLVTDLVEPFSPPNSLGIKSDYDRLLPGDIVELTFTDPTYAIGLYLITSAFMQPGAISLTAAGTTVHNESDPLMIFGDGGEAYFVGVVSDEPFFEATISSPPYSGVFAYTLDNITRCGSKPACAPADINCDGVVDVLDLLILLDNWGACQDCNNCPADFNNDCAVDVLDLLFLLDNWG